MTPQTQMVTDPLEYYREQARDERARKLLLAGILVGWVAASIWEVVRR